MNALEIKNLTASIGEINILKGLDLEVPNGALHVIMGPNGSGKSTLCHVLTGKEEYVATGSVKVQGVEVLGIPTHERAGAGIVQAFQYPVEIPGVTLRDLMEELAGDQPDPDAFWVRVEKKRDEIKVGRFMDRAINLGLSGGEKKRSEIFQISVLDPVVAVLDEIDSGLDVDAVREVAEAVEAMRTDDLAVLLITHYDRILRYLKPDRIHVMMDGRIARSGGPELARELEGTGYEAFRAIAES
ncbi:MAG: Fe-S cluster assembly ATPase SufC [Acidimicrobiia bacterium]|nr:Fe-S cluster assembly ATPase SufC [Acidimicrobiia bacterium]